MSKVTRDTYVLYVEWWDGSREVVGTFPSPQRARLWAEHARRGVASTRVLTYRDVQRVPVTDKEDN